jgi:NAD(P)-dependent dehydrogenase (short-subunit alcohol dehydrogenase family)
MGTRTGLLQGRRAFITGAAGGIGAATARRFGEEGAQVVLADLDAAATESVAAGLRDDGHDARALRLDVTDDAQVAAVVAAAAELLGGGLDTVIANAGVLRLGLLEETTEDLLRLCLDVNVVGTVSTLRHAVPRMADGGAIVCTASVAGLEGSPELTAYCASKFAVVGIVQSLARELTPRGIRVNGVAPGLVDTPMLASFFAERARIRGTTAEAVRESLVGRVPLGRLAEPAEVADVIVYLASDLSRYVSGATVPVLGGEVA